MALLKRDRLYKGKWWVTASIILTMTMIEWFLINLALNYIPLVLRYALQSVKGNTVPLDFQWRYLVHAPGVTYYITLTLAAALTVLYGIKLNVRIQQRLFPSSTIEGSSRWAKKREIQKELTAIPRAALTNPEPLNRQENGGVLIAMDNKHCYVDTGDIHTVVVGAARSGKTQYAILNTLRLLIMARHSLIVNDMKGELLEYTYTQLAACNYIVYVLNLRLPKLSHGYQLYDRIISNYVKARKSGDDFSETSDCVGELATYLTENRKSDPIWPTCAKALLEAMIKFLLDDGYNRDCLDRLNLYSTYVFFIEYGSKTIIKGKKELNALDDLFSNLPAGHWAKLSYASSKFAEGDMRASIFATLSGNLEFVADVGIAQMTSTNEIHFEDLYRTDRPCAIFMAIPDEKPNRHKLASLFIAQSYSALISAAYQFPRQRLPRRVTYVLDETGLLPRISDLDVKVSGCLSRGVSFYFCLQALSQMDDKYGEKPAMSILASCHNKIYVLSQDPNTNEYFSKLLSKESVEVETSSGESGDLLNKRRNTHIKARLLKTPDELGRQPEGELLIVRQRSFPIKTQLVPYYKLNIAYTPLEQIPAGKPKGTPESFLYPFIQPDAAQPVPNKKPKQMPVITPDMRRAIINACNLKTQMRFEQTLNDGDKASAGEMAEQLLEDGAISEKEYEVISDMVAGL